MKQETKKILRNFGIYAGIEVLIGFLVVWAKGFFTDSPAVNLQITADAFFVAGIMMTLFAGMVFVSNEGGLISIGYLLKSAFLIFVPMGRLRHEKFPDYRERKMAERKKLKISCPLITGLVFLFVGVLLTVIWYLVFYNV